MKFNIENVSFISIALLPITIIIGQAALSINYFIIFFCFFLLLKNKDFKNIVIKYSPFILPFFIFLIISCLLKFNYYENNKLDKSILYLKNFFLFFVVFYLLRRPIYRKLFYRIILICCIFVALDNFIQFIFEYDIFGNRKSKFRLTGPFGDNEFVTGSYLAKLVILILPILAIYKNKFFLNKFSYLLIIFFFLAILITGERASLFLFVLGVMIFYFLKEKNIKSTIFLTSMFLLLTILAILFNNTLRYKFYQTSYQLGVLKYYVEFVNVPDQFKDTEKRGFNDTKHAAHFLTAYEIWKNNIFFGVGTKNFSQECSNKIYQKIDSLNAESRCTTHPHNIYLELLAENGLFGIFFFLLIIIKIFYSSIITNNKNNIFFKSAISQVTIILWPFISTGSLISNFNGSFIWINLAILFSICENGYEYEKF